MGTPAHWTAVPHLAVSPTSEHPSADARPARRVFSANVAPAAEIPSQRQAADVAAAERAIARRAETAGPNQAIRHPERPAMQTTIGAPHNARPAVDRPPDLRQLAVPAAPQPTVPTEPAGAVRSSQEPVSVRSKREAPAPSAGAQRLGLGDHAAAPERVRLIVARTAPQVQEVLADGPVVARGGSEETLTPRVADDVGPQIAPPDQGRTTVWIAAPASDRDLQQPHVMVTPGAAVNTTVSESADTGPGGADRSRGGNALPGTEAPGLRPGQRIPRDEIARASADQAGRRHSPGPAPERDLSPTGIEFAIVRRPGHARVSIDGLEPTVSIRETARASLAELRPDCPQRVMLTVDPPELGRCELELSMHEGRIHATVIADRPETVIALRGVEGHLREQLAAQDMYIAEFDVRGGTQAASGQGGGQGSFRGGDHPRQSMPAPRTFAADAPADVRHQAARRRAGSGTIDLVA